MGYDLHITRANNWIDSEEEPISREEWRAYIESDSELENTKDDELGASWYGEGGRLGKSTCIGGFWWSKGRIVEKNPTEAEIRKMTQIATALNARVVGDSDEEYHTNGEIWEEKYIDKAPGLFQRLCAWWTGTSLPERRIDWVVTGKWDKLD